MRTRLFVLAGACGLLGFTAMSPCEVWAAIAAPAARAGVQEGEGGARWIRVVEPADGKSVQLQIAVRSFVEEGKDGPVVFLASAVHIADPSFYADMQASLDRKDVVLYEGVKPPGGARELDANATDAERAEATRKRIRFIAMAVEMSRGENGVLPSTLEGVSGTQSADGLGKLVARSMNDGWGHGLIYTVKGEDFEIASLGSDGAKGGEGPARDQTFTEQPPLDDHELWHKNKDKGIQQQLARALGLVFQLDEMDHSKPNWRNSDMTVDELEERLGGGGEGESEELFAMLEGSSLSAKVASAILRIVRSSPTLSILAKVLMLEMLAQADELLKAVPGEMGKMMDVIVKDRNEVVLNDLRGVLKEPGVSSIGVIYGAGHMPDLAASLERMGFKEKAVVWLTAIDADLTKGALPAEQINELRGMMRGVLKEQIGAMQGK